jgi:hypothetical protein
MALTLHGFMGVLAVFLASVLLASAAEKSGLSNPFVLLPAYFGTPGKLPLSTVQIAFGAVPRPIIWVFCGLIVYLVSVFIGLYARWRPAYLAYLVNSAITLVLAIVAAFMPSPGLVAGGVGATMAVLMFFLFLQLDDDFRWDERRILLRLDTGRPSGLNYLSRGDYYARRGLWALAAIHLRRAIGKLPDRIDARLALATTYVNLRRFGLARKTLADAGRMSPDNRDVERMVQFLDDAEARELAGSASSQRTTEKPK